MGKQRRKKKSKSSKNKKNKPSQLKNKNIVNDKKNLSKYNQLNMKVQDMVRKLELDSEQIEFIDNPDQIKMSAVILKLAEPFIKMYWGNENRVRGIVSLTIMAWNMSFLPQKEETELQEKLIEEVLPNDCNARDVASMLSVFEDLQERQKKLFPNSKKFIMGYNLRLDRENIHLDISSAPLKKISDSNKAKMPNFSYTGPKR